MPEVRFKSNSRVVYSIFILISLVLLFIFLNLNVFEYQLQKASGAYVKAKPISGGPSITDPKFERRSCVQKYW